jgi:hypothetical protein
MCGPTRAILLTAAPIVDAALAHNRDGLVGVG